MAWSEIQSFLDAIGSLTSGIAASVGIYVAYKLHKNQKTLAQRQLLLPLWDHMATMSAVDRNAPVTPDVIHNVNTLELVALCCEGGMIDEAVIMRTFRDQFMARYEEIDSCNNIPGFSESGRQLLNQNRAAQKFYQKLRNARLNQDQISGI